MRPLPSNNNGRQQQLCFPLHRETKIDDLPDELLGLIFRQLPPWLHRVRVEGVSKRFQRVALAHGWADVREFSTEQRNELTYHPAWWGPLLSRVGPYVTTIQLWEEFAHQNSGEALRVELGKCPRVKHLSLCWEQPDLPIALEHIGRAYSNTLKSLQLFNEYGSDCSAEAVRALSQALGNLYALEFLDLWECREEACMQELHLSAQSLANLRHLSLGVYYDSSRILSDANLEVLVALPSLRSFSLRQWETIAELSFLKRFTHLEHLYITPHTDGEVEIFIEALPHLGKTLKALESLSAPISLPLFERLMAALTEHLPLLEHLTLSVEFEGIVDMERQLLQKCLFDPLGFSPYLQNLRSLILRLHEQLEPLSWAWLEGMSQRLEYLELGQVMPPLSTLCCIVRNGKNLRGLNLTQYGFDLNAPNRKLLIEASFEAASTVSSGGEKVALAKVELPILRIGLRTDKMNRDDPEYENNTTDSRVRFCHSYRLRSHVLDHYKFGCLSEGKPSFVF